MKALGAIVFVAGIFFWCGNVFRFFPTFPLVGYGTMVLGGWMYNQSGRNAS